MTFRTWEYELRGQLRDVPEPELRSICDYYAEIHGDKKDAGFSDEEILAEFGTPAECAERIRSEGIEGVSPKRPLADKITDTVNTAKSKISIPSGSAIAGLALLTVFAIIPLFSVLLSVVITFASLSLGGASFVIGGAGLVIYSFVLLFSGYGFPVFLSMLGTAICTAGIGALLAIGFYYATKYSAIGSYKLLCRIYARKEKN